MEPQQVQVTPRDPGSIPTYDQDHVVFTLRPTMIFVAIWYGIAALILVAAAAVLGLIEHALRDRGGVPTSVTFLVILVVAIIAFAIPAYKHLLIRSQLYTLTNHKLEMRYGLISQVVRNIPLRNIQDVTVIAGAFQRLLGLGEIVIDSASESGKIRISNVRNPVRYADMILAELRRR
ncbi:MAG: PH domain-containing protein [Blastocatellia bacterium]